MTLAAGPADPAAQRPLTLPAAQRLLSLDVVRGVAVCGILLLNIIAFGLPDAAYFNPRADGGWHGADLAVWLVNFVLFDGKMRALFSMLFGASLLLVIDRAEAAGRDPVRVHFARMAWLLIFGLAHLWLVWDGDILAHYALVGMIALFFRRLPAERLVVVGVLLVFAQALIFAEVPVGIFAALHAPPADAARAAQTLSAMNRDFGIPPAQEIAREIALHRRGYAAIAAARVHAQALAPIEMLRGIGWETLAYMLFGMAAMKNGLFTGGWPRRRLLRCAAICFAIGVPGYALLALWLVRVQFALLPMALVFFLLTIPLRPVLMLGWACLILLLARPGGAGTQRIAAAGRMAFSNYIATSLICTTLFYGYGLGWFGMLGRAQLYWVVLAVWAAMLGWSLPWLRHFRYGPLEWLWRSLARGRPQPMRGPAMPSVRRTVANAAQ